jgi:signal transduction histidine kinase
MLGREPGKLAGADWSKILRAVGPSSGTGPLRALGERPDGSTVALEASLAAHQTSRGRIVTVILRDLSVLDRSLLTQQLTEEREAFLSMAAHQLRAPIQPILTSLRTIERALGRGIRPPPDTLPRAVRQAQRLGRLVDAILKDAAAISRGDLAIRVSSFDLAILTVDIVEDFRMAALGRPIVYHGPHEGVVVASDPDRVHQILIGLIDNALKYSAHQRVVTVELSASESRVLVTVIDEGIGIPVEEQASVFGKFYRASNAPGSAPGLGVGLYLAQGLARKLHGNLTVASEVGQGSAFSLSLPKKWPETDTIGAAAPAHRGFGGASPLAGA